MSEQRPVDMVNEAIGTMTEAAELTEHIRDNPPQYTREELFSVLIEMIDEAHGKALEASVELENND